MDYATVNEVIDCTAKERDIFHYYKDRYAALLLAKIAGEGTSVRALKASAFGKLLEKPGVKEFVATVGNGEINQDGCENLWSYPLQTFVLTQSYWGGRRPAWQQTSRKGYNLVLQLNFCNKHERQFEQLIKPKLDHVFNYRGHPVLERNDQGKFRNTLAWARIDLDFDCEQALIEEIQTDWVRKAKRALASKRARPLYDADAKPEEIRKYVLDVLSEYAIIWAEAMLIAAIRYIVDEIGIRKIFYHTSEAGAIIKRVGVTKPPRSLYSELPRKFCFKKTQEQPEFLLRERAYCKLMRKHGEFEWHTLTL